MEYRIRPYYKIELAQAYAPDISPGAALNRLALWIKTNNRLPGYATDVYLETGSTDI